MHLLKTATTILKRSTYGYKRFDRFRKNTFMFADAA